MNIILGPPGTGKTTYLLNKVEEYLQKGIPPDRIGYFGFTRRAASEAIDRACESLNYTDVIYLFSAPFIAWHLCRWVSIITNYDC